MFKSNGTLCLGIADEGQEPKTPFLKKRVVYVVPYLNCNKSYIGKTGRNLKKRLVEHKETVKRGDTKNGIVHWNSSTE